MILGIYTATTTAQEGKVADKRRQFDLEQATEFRQQAICDKFLDDIYKLEKDGYLNEEKNPWAFANARFRAAHRQWDAICKADILQFLKENQLIGRKPNIKNRAVKKVDNIIHLNDLNFDNISLTSPTGSLNSLNLEYVVFDQVSMINARFSFVNLRETSFSHSRLNNVKFSDSSLAYASFDSTELDGTDFGNTNMIGVEFSNIDLCTTTLTEIQLQQIVFTNSILPNSSICGQEKTTSTPSMITISTTEALSTSQSIFPNIPANARWVQNGTTVAGGHGQGNVTNQLNYPFSLFIGDDQTMVIADYWNHRIMQWKMGDMNGQVVAGGHDQGNRLDQLNRPTGVMIDRETDSLIICDQWNQRVVQWSRRSGTTQGEILINDITCFGLAMDDQRYLYISDSGENAVTRYQLGNNSGTIVAGGYGEGADLEQFNWPRYLFVDRQQAVYVSDYYNHRVMKWNKGAKEGIVVAGGQGQGNASTQLYRPTGLFVDTLGTIYVGDETNDRVMRWSQGAKEGTVIVGGNGQGAAANQLYTPTGLSFDRHGNLYVADYENHRVQRFSIE
ncbi:unnamed protein product [Rotaria sordida]|uniref:Uncharacterized protein n=1 Tax=Rotaria sordida TaxID=392033 RepID=A0A814F172_9BILA|nr:unnamed protein product [Rotaria sordida]CAF1040712.1 unnamed protein product [Rotaria sordida]